MLARRNLLKDSDLTKEEHLYLIDLAATLRSEKRAGAEQRHLTGRNIALIFEKASTRTRAAFEVGAYDQGALVTCFGPGETHLGREESTKDTARVLGRMFDGIEFRGFFQRDADLLGHFAGVPVWNGLTDTWHPTQLLADSLTMRDHSTKPLDNVALCYCGDARNNTASSLLVTSALLGLDVRMASPPTLAPSSEVIAIATDLANRSGAEILITDDMTAGVRGVDFIYTDVWLSMGEPEENWDERIKTLIDYQVNAKIMAASENPDVKFMHCLPALHTTETVVGQSLFNAHGLRALEVTDDVFESSASVVFDQAENRLHTIKALMVATLGN